MLFHQSSLVTRETQSVIDGFPEFINNSPFVFCVYHQKIMDHININVFFLLLLDLVAEVFSRIIMVNVSIFKIYVAPNVLKQQLEDYSAMLYVRGRSCGRHQPGPG